MRLILPSLAKINLTLRVINKRPDGYHNLVSAFVRIASGEVLYISESSSRTDTVSTNMHLDGENIVLKALRAAREEGFRVPPLDVKIHKSIPPGSGLGAGSGNAAVILLWLGAERVAPRVGADVAFLCSGASSALVSGIGDVIEPMNEPQLHGVVAIPDWQTNTKAAYAELDTIGYNVDSMLARKEVRDIYHSNAKAGRRLGLLQNDFLKVLLREHKNYNELFGILDAAGADAWGVTGSGSAVFGIMSKPGVMMKWPGYVKHVLHF